MMTLHNGCSKKCVVNFLLCRWYTRSVLKIRLDEFSSVDLLLFRLFLVSRFESLVMEKYKYEHIYIAELQVTNL